MLRTFAPARLGPYARSSERHAHRDGPVTLAYAARAHRRRTDHRRSSPGGIGPNATAPVPQLGRVDTHVTRLNVSVSAPPLMTA